jgi:hypothetical protein
MIPFQIILIPRFELDTTIGYELVPSLQSHDIGTLQSLDIGTRTWRQKSSRLKGNVL